MIESKWLAIIQAFTALWEIKLEQMAVNWNVVPEYEGKWKYLSYMSQIVIERLISKRQI